MPDTGSLPPTMHHMDCWPDPFRAMRRGEKRCLIRRDQGYKVGDIVLLREYVPEHQAPDERTPAKARHLFEHQVPGYTGEEDYYRILWVAAESGPVGYQFVALSVARCDATGTFQMHEYDQITRLLAATDPKHKAEPDWKAVAYKIAGWLASATHSPDPLIQADAERTVQKALEECQGETLEE